MATKIYTSYFYQVRFLMPWQIPLSTAVWDPKWFHNFKGQDCMFLDRRGVLNGDRLEWLVPGDSCSGLCRGREGCMHTPDTCAFLRKYSEQLHTLCFEDLMSALEAGKQACREAVRLDALRGDRDIEYVLLFHEGPNNPCSERWPVKAWFKENGYELEEFQCHRVSTK